VLLEYVEMRSDRIVRVGTARISYCRNTSP
jgi:hypothetical protein